MPAGYLAYCKCIGMACYRRGRSCLVGPYGKPFTAVTTKRSRCVPSRKPARYVLECPRWRCAIRAKSIIRCLKCKCNVGHCKDHYQRKSYCNYFFHILLLSKSLSFEQEQVYSCSALATLHCQMAMSLSNS